MDTTERAAIYTKYAEEAAEQFRCKPTDMPAKLAATRRLAFELYQVGLIDGRNPDPSILKWFLEEEAKHTPPPEIPKVNIAFVETLQGVCPKCGYTHDTGKPVTDPDPPPSPPSGPPTPPPTEKPSLSATASNSNVVPLRKAGGSIHDAPGARMAGPSYAFCAGGASSNPFSAGPRPDFERGHVLPSPRADITSRT
jgi:hypothetical protein